MTKMNLNAYDNITEKLDKTKTWIDINTKRLISRQIVFRAYTCLLKRYDANTNTNSFFIATLDNPPEHKKYKHTIVDSYGRIKLSLSSIWNESYLCQLSTNCNISIERIEHSDDGDIYFIDV